LISKELKILSIYFQLSVDFLAQPVDTDSERVYTVLTFKKEANMIKTQLGHLDWQATKDLAKNMTTPQLWGAILDIQKTLPMADAMDRSEGTTRGGLYRDESSVYRAELNRRQGN
jgi:hypothetical protein